MADTPPPDRRDQTPEQRRKILLAALRRPMGLLVLLIGVVFFAATLEAWVPIAAVATYATITFLAARDPVFKVRVLEGRESARRLLSGTSETLPPERRARWLPRGETRQKVEAALEMHRKIEQAITESDDVTRSVLDDAIPKLRETVARLVDLALRREQAVGAVADLRAKAQQHPSDAREALEENLRRTESEIEAADRQISGTFEQLLSMRSRVIRISIETDAEARAASSELNRSLNEMNFRLDALAETMTLPGDSTSDRRAT